MAMKYLARNNTEPATGEKATTTTAAHKIESMSLVLLQVNYRNIYNKTLAY